MPGTRSGSPPTSTKPTSETTPPSGWLNGYDDVLGGHHPVLGFVYGDDVWFGTDGLHTQYTVTFKKIKIGPYTGKLIRTTDGNEYDEPHNVWVSSAGVEPEEGESALMR